MSTQQLTELYNRLDLNMNAMEMTQWFTENPIIPLVCAGTYIAAVFGGQAFMANREAFNPQLFFTIWNLLLAVFSIIGGAIVIPTWVSTTLSQRQEYLMCEPATNWWMNGPTGTWIILFALSKIPEFVDTFFLVVRKRPVIFLHWYHHFTVQLYCWFGLGVRLPAGIIFAGMNYFVHSIMYSYYFMMSVSFLRPFAKPFAMSITILQLAQMVVGLYVTVRTQMVLEGPDGASCGADRTLNLAGMAMYASYFVLFGNFFYHNYVKDGGRKRK